MKLEGAESHYANPPIELPAPSALNFGPGMSNQPDTQTLLRESLEQGGIKLTIQPQAPKFGCAGFALQVCLKKKVPKLFPEAVVLYDNRQVEVRIAHAGEFPVDQQQLFRLENIVMQQVVVTQTHAFLYLPAGGQQCGGFLL